MFSRLFCCCGSVDDVRMTLKTTKARASASAKGVIETSGAMFLNETEEFLPPIAGEVFVLSVHDGDTITIGKKINIEGTTHVYRFHIRTAGFDAPELHPKTKLDNGKLRPLHLIEEECALAKAATKRMEVLVLHKTVVLQNVKNDKYGNRHVADVIVDGKNVCDIMIGERLAVPYSGKHKGDMDWKKYHETGHAGVCALHQTPRARRACARQL